MANTEPLPAQDWRFKTADEHKAEFKSNEARFDILVPYDADELSIVLKGHLLIEEQLRLIVRSLLANPEYFDKARLNFATLLKLARAVAGHFNQGACWAAADKLNTLRNHMAHQVEPIAAPALLERFYAVCEADERWSNIHALPRGRLKLRAYICATWVVFDALRAVVQVCVRTCPNPLNNRPSGYDLPKDVE
ncbi:hypothetical protein [Massilia suwonensis]|uniref:DUF4145 domain-containing protein n=1 Tax=Massilia suwonensis TaxID=648895 RepID=A0ABW0MF52_9BURK